MIEIEDKEWFSWEGVNRIKRKCREAALREGLSDEIDLFFRTENLFMEALQNKKSYRQRNKEWRGKCLAKSTPNPLVDALQKIADGHNNPRALAREVLKSI